MSSCVRYELATRPGSSIRNAGLSGWSKRSRTLGSSTAIPETTISFLRPLPRRRPSSRSHRVPSSHTGSVASSTQTANAVTESMSARPERKRIFVPLKSVHTSVGDRRRETIASLGRRASRIGTRFISMRLRVGAVTIASGRVPRPPQCPCSTTCRTNRSAAPHDLPVPGLGDSAPHTPMSVAAGGSQRNSSRCQPRSGLTSTRCTRSWSRRRLTCRRPFARRARCASPRSSAWPP